MKDFQKFWRYIESQWEINEGEISSPKTKYVLIWFQKSYFAKQSIVFIDKY